MNERKENEMPDPPPIPTYSGTTSARLDGMEAAAAMILSEVLAGHIQTAEDTIDAEVAEAIPPLSDVQKAAKEKTLPERVATSIADSESVLSRLASAALLTNCDAQYQQCIADGNTKAFCCAQYLQCIGTTMGLPLPESLDKTNK
jgi:hypothetical protein